MYLCVFLLWRRDAAFIKFSRGYFRWYYLFSIHYYFLNFMVTAPTSMKVNEKNPYVTWLLFLISPHSLFQIPLERFNAP